MTVEAQKRATHKNKRRDYLRAKRLRHDSPFLEKNLWFLLRMQTKESNLTFRRQQPLHPYIVDFVCLKARLIVELDGFSHDAGQERDQKRDSFLRQSGYEVMRFSNEVFQENPGSVIETIIQRAQARISDVR